MPLTLFERQFPIGFSHYFNHGRRVHQSQSRHCASKREWAVVDPKLRPAGQQCRRTPSSQGTRPAAVGGQAVQRLRNGWEQVSAAAGGWQRCQRG
ncbi:hypothetical protein FFY45_20385 [Xanthomonas hortorum]|nr:hypothetical protein [Xanthomonas hortorum]